MLETVKIVLLEHQLWCLEVVPRYWNVGCIHYTKFTAEDYNFRLILRT
jgi:hypothetical protein